MPFAHTDNLDLHYVQIDRAREHDALEDLVLVHGLAANLGFWYFKLAPLFSAHYRVTMFDLRGHGLSGMPEGGYTAAAMADDLAALLDHLGIERAHLLAHSFGGAVALHFALHRPQRVRSLTFADVRIRSLQPGVRLRDWPQWPRYSEMLREAGIDIDENEPDFGLHLFEQLARLRVESPQRSDRLHRLVPSPFAGAAGARAAARWLRLLEQTSARRELLDGAGLDPDTLRAIDKPVLGVYGEYSHAMPTARALQAIWPHARMEIVPRAGHFFPLRRPEYLAQPALAFLAQCNGAVQAESAATAAPDARRWLRR